MDQNQDVVRQWWFCVQMVLISPGWFVCEPRRQGWSRQWRAIIIRLDTAIAIKPLYTNIACISYTLLSSWSDQNENTLFNRIRDMSFRHGITEYHACLFHREVLEEEKLSE